MAIFKMNDNFFVLAKRLGELCAKQNVRIAFAESCTGGMLASLITQVSGASEWFLGSAVVYSNAAKHNLISVDLGVLQQYGAVSEAVAQAMAKGAMIQFEADIALSITGLAGPLGGSVQKPVGTVCFALVDRRTDMLISKTMHFESGREWIRQSAVLFALEWMIGHLCS